MYESLLKKTAAIADKYADLALRQIMSALDSRNLTQEEFYQVQEGVRVVSHVVMTLTRVDRLCGEAHTDDQG